MYWTCPDCGANLDPGEICFDCREKENAASSGANTEDGADEKSSLTE